jgi:hypothetical protein
MDAWRSCWPMHPCISVTVISVCDSGSIYAWLSTTAGNQNTGLSIAKWHHIACVLQHDCYFQLASTNMLTLILPCNLSIHVQVLKYPTWIFEEGYSVSKGVTNIKLWPDHENRTDCFLEEMALKPNVNLCTTANCPEHYKLHYGVQWCL